MKKSIETFAKINTLINFDYGHLESVAPLYELFAVRRKLAVSFYGTPTKATSEGYRHEAMIKIDAINEAIKKHFCL